MAKRKTEPRKNTPLAQKGGIIPAVAKVATEIRDLIEAARNHVSVAANLAMVNLYWNIGRIITQEMQKEEARAGYGERLVERLGSILSRDYGNGFSARNLWDMKRFFGEFQILQPLAAELGEATKRQMPSNKSLAGQILPIAPVTSSERIIIDFRKHFRLGWTHYRMLLSISDLMQRRFYFEQAASQHWSKREFRRQIDRGLFECVALSRDIPRLVAQEKQTGPAEIVRYEDIFKDPYVLDFLGLKGAYSEKDLEAAIVHNLEQFLTELGTDFCFIGRQYAMRIDEDDYFLDLLFYHRGLRCLVAIDLKIGTFTAADKGQMDLYLAWLKEHDWRPGENEPAGLILCTSARRQHVELLLRHGPHKMKVAEYLTHLPDKRLLEERLKMYGRLLKDRDFEHAKETDR
ncbi:MAG: PDDEXK nuclease domain-containing protein [Phycisphaerae bacterium]|nr:PDDEXK nuclease domain-containing protein [Phycisphaerae bacterium]